MDNTKKGENISDKSLTSKSGAKKTTFRTELVSQEKIPVAAKPYIPKPLYVEIANSVHGLGKKIIQKVGKEGEEDVIDIELCEWQIPSVNKKKDCETLPCPPEQEG